VSKFASALPNLHGARVLLVEDYPSLRDLLREVLEDCGAWVVAADSAVEALNRFDSHRPDVLVSDLALPDHDGYWLISQIRQRSPEHGGQTPAIAMTADPKTFPRSRALLAGFQAFLAKPVDPDELCASIAQLVAELL
jgi:CheY-like chemotaxis protein